MTLKKNKDFGRQRAELIRLLFSGWGEINPPIYDQEILNEIQQAAEGEKY